MDWIFHIESYQTWIYVILALVVFCETGLVATPFLPGDSLLFTAGAFFAQKDLSIVLLIVILCFATWAGDQLNYFLGRKWGIRLFRFKLLNIKHLYKTQTFYEKHGGKTLVIARFLPIIRTFAPFAAGIAQMRYRRFLSFCVLGALLWVPSLTYAGYQLGELEVVKKNFELVILAIILLSLLPVIIGYLASKKTEA